MFPYAAFNKIVPSKTTIASLPEMSGSEDGTSDVGTSEVGISEGGNNQLGRILSHIGTIDHK